MTDMAVDTYAIDAVKADSTMGIIENGDRDRVFALGVKVDHVIGDDWLQGVEDVEAVVVVQLDLFDADLARPTGPAREVRLKRLVADCLGIATPHDVTQHDQESRLAVTLHPDQQRRPANLPTRVLDAVGHEVNQQAAVPGVWYQDLKVGLHRLNRLQLCLGILLRHCRQKVGAVGVDIIRAYGIVVAR